MSDEREGEGNAPLPNAADRAFAESIFATESYQQRVPPARPFEAWHKPRKQLVREELWGAEIEWLLAQKAPNDKSLRYLGLPGADLLDLRYLYERFCSDGQHELTFLGFDDAALPDSLHGDSLNISLQEMRSRPNVDKSSEVIGDDLRLLADENSIAWDYAKRLGPFDAVNIDLCGHLGRDEPSIDLSIYNAIHHICGLQNRRSRPWSLFLTSRINRENVASAALEKLMLALEHNLTTCEEFRDCFSTRFGSAEVGRGSMASWTDETFFGAITLAIAKWLLGMAEDMNCSFSAPKNVGYKVWNEAAYLDMTSVVYRFVPATTIGPDRTGLASAVPIRPNECQQAMLVQNELQRLVDIDA